LYARSHSHSSRIEPNEAPWVCGRIKTGSSNHINEQRWIGCRFSWQEGFGAFSVSHSHISAAINYIRNQEIHHRRKSFQQEYLEFLERHKVPYDERFVFKPVE
jgi:putative transposase